jgi:hypothetical protein
MWTKARIQLMILFVVHARLFNDLFSVFVITEPLYTVIVDDY